MNDFSRKTNELCGLLSAVGKLPYGCDEGRSLSLRTLQAETETELGQVVQDLKEKLLGFVAKLDAIQGTQVSDVERERDEAQAKLQGLAAWADELEADGIGPGVVRRFLAQEIRRRIGNS